MKHLFIVNPQAGRRNQTSRVLAMAEGLRKNHGLDCACLLTQSPGHAVDLARQAALTGQKLRIYACGGDGTAHEVANGLAGFDNAAMTCIPIGTGNDFLKNFGDDIGLFSDAEHLWDGDAFPLDLIDCNGEYCLTIACSGIDARVGEAVHRYSGTPFLGGRGSYLASVAVNMLKGVSEQWTVTLDDEEIEGEFSLVSTCNGRYYGGGSMPIPEARMTDGILDTVLVKKVGRLTFARLFPRYSAGRYRELSDYVRVVRAQTVRIRSREEIVTCLDGECFRSHDVTLRLAEKKVNFFGPKGCDPDRTAR